MSASTERSGWFLAVAFRVFSAARFSSVFSVSPTVLCWVVPRAAWVTVFRPGPTVSTETKIIIFISNWRGWETLWYRPWGRLNNFIRLRRMMECEFQVHSKLTIARCQFLSKTIHMYPKVKSSNWNINERAVSHCANSPSDDFCSLSWAWPQTEDD